MATSAGLTARRTPRFRTLPRPALLVAGAYLLCAAFLAVNAVKVRSFIWLTDEVLWAKAARSFAEWDGLLSPTVRGEVSGPPNGLYPHIISPLYALLDAPAAYTATHVVNALLFSLALIPVYLLVRRLGLGVGWALAGGVMSVLLPWSVATLVVMTEPLTYPLFLWALYAMVVAVAEPRPRHDVLALVAIGVTAYARTQFVSLAAVLVLGIVARELALRDPWRSRRVRLRAHAPLLAVLVIAPIAYLLLRAAGVDLVGTYGGLFESAWFPGGVWNASMLHVAYLVGGSAVLPFVLWLAWLARIAGTERPTPYELSFAIVGALAFGLTVYQAGFFAQTLVGGLPQERYVFYVVPVMLVGMLLLVADRQRPSPRLTIFAGALIAAAAVAAGGWEGSISGGPFGAVASAARGMNPVVSQHLSDWLGRSHVEAMVIAAAVVALLAIPALALRRRFAWAGPALVGVVAVALFAQSVWLLDETRDGMNRFYPGVLFREGEIPKNWVDEAVGENGDVGFFAGELPVNEDGVHWAYTEFFNHAVDQPAITVGDRPNPNMFAVRKARVDAGGRLVGPSAFPKYVVAPTVDPTLGLRGRVVTRAPWGAAVIEPQVPWSVAYQLTGGSYAGNASGTKPLRLRVFEGARPTRVTVELSNDPEGPASLPYVIRSGDAVERATLAKGEKRRVVLTTAPAGRASELTIEPGGSQELVDGRVVGLRAAVVSVG